ncbi:MAG: restriction endonuclease subunit S, partial [Methanothrix sp.]|nr:restriction endonuclease subunit S [Methanothrix sp.]
EESELGPKPEGWEVKTFGEISLNFDRRRKPLSSMQRASMKGEYPYYGAAKIIDYINDYLFEGEYLLVAEDGSVITNNRNPVLQLVDGKFWPNNHTHVIQGKMPVSTIFIYLFMSQVDISGYITGAAQPKITQANLNRIPVIVPSGNLLNQFNDIVQDIVNQQKLLQTKNSNLRRTRDLLLPKLISGEIDVEGLEIEGAEA